VPSPASLTAVADAAVKPTLTRWLTALASVIAPPLCGACAGPCELHEPICQACATALRRSNGAFFAVPGAETAWAAVPYEGTAQRLVSALKFAGRLPLAHAAAEAILSSIPAGLATGAIVPVPPSPHRRRTRGFDPTALIAEALAERLALPCLPALVRTDGPRQVGRPRRRRLADPPHVRAVSPAPPVATLVDDVTTTGATLTSSALALRAGGAERVVAVTFARTPGLAQARGGA
jgi:predicted amidophosphoribosyltransferase